MTALEVCKMFRPTCSGCGAGGLRWMSPLDLVPLQPDAAAREEVRDALLFVGVDGYAWSCPRCSEWGLFE